MSEKLCWYYDNGKCRNICTEVSECADPCSQCDWWAKDKREIYVLDLIEFLDDMLCSESIAKLARIREIVQRQQAMDEDVIQSIDTLILVCENEIAYTGYLKLGNHGLHHTIVDDLKKIRQLLQARAQKPKVSKKQVDELALKLTMFIAGELKKVKGKSLMLSLFQEAVSGTIRDWLKSIGARAGG